MNKCQFKKKSGKRKDGSTWYGLVVRAVVDGKEYKGMNFEQDNDEEGWVDFDE